MPERDGSLVEGSVDLARAGGGLDRGEFVTIPASWRVEAVAWSTRSRNASALPASSENQDDIIFEGQPPRCKSRSEFIKIQWIRG